MPAVHGKGQVILSDQYNLGSWLSQIDVQEKVATHDVTTLGAASKAFFPGLSEGTVNLSGFWDGATSAIDAILLNLKARSTDANIAIARQGFAIGNRVEMFNAIETDYKKGGTVADMVKITGAMLADGFIDTGVSLHQLQAETANVTGASVDNTTSTSNGGVAQVHCTAISGTTPSFTPIVGHSTDNVTFTALATLTALTAVGTQRLTVATGTTVNRYIRDQSTIGGTTPSATYSLNFARR